MLFLPEIYPPRFPHSVPFYCPPCLIPPAISTLHAQNPPPPPPPPAAPPPPLQPVLCIHRSLAAWVSAASLKTYSCSMLILVRFSLSVSVLSFLSVLSVCTCSSPMAPVAFRTPVLCHAKRSSFMMSSPPRTSRAISVCDAFCTYGIDSHLVSKSSMAVIAREYLPTDTRTFRESVCRIFGAA